MSLARHCVFRCILAIVLPLAAHGAGARKLAVAIGPYYWDEANPDGTPFVKERGARLEAALTVPAYARGDFEFHYRGTIYGSLLRHEGWDRARVVIPEGYEDSVSGHVGTAHSLVGSLRLASTPPVPRLEVALTLDAWYRALNYFELWVVPSARYGAGFGYPDGRWSVFVGVSTTFAVRETIQTTKAPWNVGNNTTLRPGGSTCPSLSFTFLLNAKYTVRADYLEYGFRRSDVRLLRPGFGIVQPKSEMRTVTVGIVRAF